MFGWLVLRLCNLCWEWFVGTSLLHKAPLCQILSCQNFNFLLCQRAFGRVQLIEFDWFWLVDWLYGYLFMDIDWLVSGLFGQWIDCMPICLLRFIGWLVSWLTVWVFVYWYLLVGWSVDWLWLFVYWHFDIGWLVSWLTLWLFVYSAVCFAFIIIIIIILWLFNLWLYDWRPERFFCCC